MKGLSLNGRDVTELAALASEPQALDDADLSKAFDIHTENYLGHVLNVIQDRSQSVSSLKSISIYFGKMPKKYAAQCREDLSDDFCLFAPGALPIRLGRLINQGKRNVKFGQVEKFANYQEFLEHYGDWVLVDVEQVINARGARVCKAVPLPVVMWPIKIAEPQSLKTGSASTTCAWF